MEPLGWALAAVSGGFAFFMFITSFLTYLKWRREDRSHRSVK